MSTSNHQRAINYALHVLHNDLDSRFVFHSVDHTCGEVVPNVIRLAQVEGVDDRTMQLLLVAAYFHDVGYTIQRLQHEAVSVGVAATVLPSFGFSVDEINQIDDMIMATRIDVQPYTLEESILADADLMVLGSANFMARNRDLRNELAAFGKICSDEEWFESQLAFIENHQYATQSANNLWFAQKCKNIAAMQQQVELLQHAHVIMN